MLAIVQDARKALDATYDRYGRPVHREAAMTARARRDRDAVAAYAAHLAPYAPELLATARRRLAALPTARHTAAWWNLLDDLAVSHTRIVEVLDKPGPPGSDTEHEQHSAVWPHLVFWAENSRVATHLVLEQPPPGPPMAEEEQREWTERAQAARGRGELDLIESWHTADGGQVTLAHLVHDDGSSSVLALSGDPDAAGWRVVGLYADEDAATSSLPPAVPGGVMRTGISWLNRPEPPFEVPLQDLIWQVEAARTSVDVSSALSAATEHCHGSGPLVEVAELLRAAGRFAEALETIRGRRVGARLAALSRQADFLMREVEEASEDLGANFVVLPPHRTAAWRTRPRPVSTTTMPPAAVPPRASTPAHRL
jgi:hypothetical protein